MFMHQAQKDCRPFPGNDKREFCLFFQAEDGIRAYKVTGVQTCALPIFLALDIAPHREDAVGLAGLGRGREVDLSREEIGRASCRERGKSAEGDERGEREKTTGIGGRDKAGAKRYGRGRRGATTGRRRWP